METAPKPALGRGKRLALALGMPLALLALFLLLAPLLLAGSAARYAEGRFAAERAGRLEVGDLQLSWTGVQQLEGVRLIDPEGEAVAELSAELPSLIDLLSGGGRRIGRVRATLSADLVADAAGVTNLRRALAARNPTESGRGDEGGGSGPDGPGDPDGGGARGGLADLELDVVLSVPRLSWSDPQTRELGTPFALLDLELTGAIAPGQPLSIDLAGRGGSDTGGSVKLHARLQDPADPASPFEFEADVTGLSTGLVDGLAGLGGTLRDLLGPELHLRGEGSGTLAGGQVALQLESETASVELRAQLEGGSLGATSQVSIEPPAELLASWIEPSLPAGLRVERLGTGAFEGLLGLTSPDFGAWLASGSESLPAGRVTLRGANLGDWRVATASAERVWRGVHVEADFGSDRAGTLTVATYGPDPLALSTAVRMDAGAELPILSDFELAVPGLPSTLVDELGQLEGRVDRLLGSRLAVQVALGRIQFGNPDDGPGGSGVLRVTSSQLELAVGAEYADGLLTLHGGGDASKAAGPAASSPRALLYRAPERLLREFAPDFEDAYLLGDLRLDLDSLELPVGSWLADDPDQLELLRSIAADLSLHLGALELPRQLADGSALPVTLERIALDVELGAGAATADLVAGVQDSDGVISMQLSAADLSGLLAEPRVPPVVMVSAQAETLPTLVVDLLAEQDGLLIDMLGPELTLRANGRWPAAGQEFEIDLSSPEASVEFHGSLEDQMIVARQGQRLTASAPLGPLFSQRVVGRLMPLLLGVTKAPDAAPLGLEVENFRFPLDGDLSKLDCDVLLDLGEVSYQLLPGFQDTLSKRTGNDSKRRTSTIDPMRIQVRAGVVTYDKTPLKIDGVEFVFGGTYDLLSGTIRMTTLVPLANLGRGVARELEKARDYLDPALSVPLEIGGTIARPTLNLGRDFIDKVIPGAAAGAIRGGLKDLFGRSKEEQAEEQRKEAEKKARKRARREAEEAAKQEEEKPPQGT